MYFRVLGPLEVASTNDLLRFAPRQRVVLSMLLLEPNRVVAVDRLIDAVWNVDPPPTAREQIQICVSSIRRTLARIGLSKSIVTRAPGYSIQCTEEHLDLLAFERSVAGGRQAVGRGQHLAAAAAFRQALELWRGVPGAGVHSQIVRHIGTLFAERWLGVIEEYVDVQLHLGRQRELISELVGHVAAHPFRERLRAQLMIALHRMGRRAEALETYRVGRKLLVEELGLEPGDELRRVERAILTGDAGTVLTPGPAPDMVVPRSLPADVGDFVGRTEQLGRIRNALCRSGGVDSPPVRVVVVAGRPWIGKTTLAVRAAHAMSDRFPDGQLFARLGGLVGRPAAVGEILERFLLALGVSGPSVPDGTDARAEIYRNRLGDRRLLVVLDDAENEQQVLPLLPGGSGCAVIVTSRARLPALPGTTSVDVGALSQPESVELLAGALGRDRARAESGDVAALAELCAGEPLALRLAAARLASRPHWPVITLVDRLAGEDRRLAELSKGGTDLAAMVDEVYRRHSALAQRLIRRIAMLGPAGVASWMCSPLLDVDAEEAEDALVELFDAGVLDVERARDGGVVFHLRGLLLMFARRLASQTPPVELDQTMRRVFGGRTAGDDLTVPHVGHNGRPPAQRATLVGLRELDGS